MVSSARRKSRPDFILSVTVDFPGDASHAVYTHELLDEMMAQLKSLGVRRVYWIYYGEEDQDSYWAGDIYRNHGDSNARDTAKSLGEPLKAAVVAAHAHDPTARSRVQGVAQQVHEDLLQLVGNRVDSRRPTVVSA